MRGRPLPVACCLFVACFLLLSHPAHADTVTVGLFAPAETFPSTSARVELAGKLADHVGKALGATAVGKVYARAGDFAAAVKKGEVTIALVDAAYLATTSGYTAIAESTRAGESAHAWQLVARDADRIAALRGKRVLAPSIGGREADFVLAVLFGGEVPRDYFAVIDTAPDTASAIAALDLGKVDAAVVPASVDLPAGVTTVVKLPAVPGPVLGAYGALPAARKDALVDALASFHGDATVAGLRATDGASVRAVAARFAPPAKRGPFVVPAVRLLVGALVEGRTFAIERTPATSYVK